MGKISPKTKKLEIGGGVVEEAPSGSTRLSIPPTPSGYANAQRDDYRWLPRGKFPWKPPLCLSLQACASHAHPLGTLGFGFWNDPFSISFGQGGASRRLPAAPKALWFFYGSPPNNLPLASEIPGYGWKAASLDSITLPTLFLAPFAACAFILSKIPIFRRWVMQTALRQVTAFERLLTHPLDHWHSYLLTWLPGEATFEVDGETVLEAPMVPSGPLGFVMWIDNQYAIATPEDGFLFGVLPLKETQWLEVSDLQIEAFPGVA
ncbi:MAG TPA: hypothetical protein G4O11_02100 [Anaerolineae bacterium]|nr:hypothetical protein [Anaerolineae bacterium]